MCIFKKIRKMLFQNETTRGKAQGLKAQNFGLKGKIRKLGLNIYVETHCLNITFSFVCCTSLFISPTNHQLVYITTKYVSQGLEVMNCY